jgi:hypothetical protein
MALLLLCAVLLTEGLIVGQLRNTVGERQILYSLFVLAAFVSILMIVDFKSLRHKSYEVVTNSTTAALFLCVLIWSAVLFDYNSNNYIGCAIRTINKNSYNLLAVSLIAGTIIIFLQKKCLDHKN